MQACRLFRCSLISHLMGHAITTRPPLSTILHCDDWFVDGLVIHYAPEFAPSFTGGWAPPNSLPTSGPLTLSIQYSWNDDAAPAKAFRNFKGILCATSGKKWLGHVRSLFYDLRRDTASVFKRHQLRKLSKNGKLRQSRQNQQILNYVQRDAAAKYLKHSSRS